MTRRTFLQTSAAAFAAGAAPRLLKATSTEPARYRLTLGQWSFHRAFRGEALPQRDTLEFPGMAAELGFEGVDYSGILLGTHHADRKYLAELNRRAADCGVRNVLILVDLTDPLGARSAAARQDAVAKFQPWLEAAATLGCSGIRVNANSDASLPSEEQARLVADGVATLVEKSTSLGLDILVENHGQGPGCDGTWIASVVRQVNHPNCGTLPDFGNFHKDRTRGEFHDRYAGVAAMLPYAKCVCAKAHDFDAEGNECHTDFARMFQLVAEAGFQGWIEVEYEGPGGLPRTPPPACEPVAPLDERAGTLATRDLLRKTLGPALQMRR